MAEPKKRLTRTRRGWRRSHDALQAILLRPCQKCKTPGLPHRVCLACGTYRGKKVESKTELLKKIKPAENQS